MSVAQTALENVRYPPEKFLETRLIAALGATARTTYSEMSVIEPRLVWLRDISFAVAGARNANISAIVEGTVAEKRYEDIVPFGSAFPELFDKLPLSIPFDYDSRVILYNASVIPLANTQGRVTWEVQDYRVTDKLSMGVSYNSLEEEEKRLADKYQLIRSIRGGKLPMEYPKGDLQYDFTGNFAGAMAVGQETNIIRRTVPDGYKLVLTKLWAAHPAANFGSLEIRVYRDKNLFLTLFPYCFPDFNTSAPTRRVMPLDLWIPALSEMRVTIFSSTGHAAELAMAEVELRRLTIWDKIAWNLENVRKITTDEERDMISELNLRDKLNAGIYELVTPLPTSALLT